MFEGRKAKKLGLEDMGMLGAKNDKAICSKCKKGGIRIGNEKQYSSLVHWCPNCMKILYEVR